MNEENAFLGSMLVSPDDEALRLVYADWLEERGDIRAEYLRLDLEIERQKSQGRVALQLKQRLAEIELGVDRAWLSFVTSLGRPFRMGQNNSEHFDIEPADLPFSEPIGKRGRVFTFRSQFTMPQSWQPGLLEDLRLIMELEWGEIAYGAADMPVNPFICELDDEGSPLTGAVVLEALKARQFKSEHIRNLAATSIPFPGYHPHTDNDEIHNDFSAQHIFENEQVDEFSNIHGALKQYVSEGQLWYVLLHPTKHDGFASYVVLFSVGRSPHGKRLVGAITHQMCHNLCD